MTSIEWLIEEMISKGFFKESVTLTNIDHLQYKAEEMHKQELLEYWKGGINCTQIGGKSFEEYHAAGQENN